MSYMSFQNADLDQLVSIDITLRQAIHLMSILAFHVESGLSVDEDNLMTIYEELFAITEPFGNIN
jgi:hypothetical protein